MRCVKNGFMLMTFGYGALAVVLMTVVGHKMGLRTRMANDSHPQAPDTDGCWLQTEVEVCCG